MERITITDGAITVELQRWLKFILVGDEKEHGLYYRLAQGQPSLAAYERIVGTIQAYETVLRQMGVIANAHGSDMEEKVVFSARPGGLN